MRKKDIHYPEKLQVVTGEYLYYKGIIRGLEEAKGKTDKEVKALMDIYAVKTKLIDKLLEEQSND